MKRQRLPQLLIPACAFLITFFLFKGAHAQTVIRGSLLGSDGLPMKSAHVVLNVSEIMDSSLVVSADSAGRYAFQAEPGGYMLQAFGVHHKPLTMPLIVTQEPIRLDIWLGTYRLKPMLDRLRVIGDFNAFHSDVGTIALERRDGRFHAALPSSADTIAYQVIGALSPAEPYLPSDFPWRIAGSDADVFSFKRDGPFRSFESNYISVVASPGGSVDIAFDPSAIPQTENPQPVVYSEPNRTAKLADLYRETEARFASVSQTLGAVRDRTESGVDSRLHEAAIQWYVNPIVHRIETEKDPLVRKWLLIRYFSQFSQFQRDIAKDLLPLFLDYVEPSSPAWSVRGFFTFGISNIVARLRTAAEGDDDLPSRLAKYAAALADHPDDDVRAQALYIATSPSLRGDDEELLWQYYLQLLTDYPHTQYAENLRRRYSPERRIQAGERIPEFRFTSLEDSTEFYTDEALRGSVYLLDFWGTWCAPCIKEMPYLHEAYEKYGSKGLSILSLAFQDTRESIKQFRADRWSMPWDHTLVMEDESQNVRTQFELTGFPRPILVDDEGIILAMDKQLRGSTLLETLRDYLDD